MFSCAPPSSQPWDNVCSFNTFYNLNVECCHLIASSLCYFALFTIVSFATDTGAEVNCLSLVTFKSLSAQMHVSHWPLRPPLGVQGATLTVHVIVTLPVNLCNSSCPVKIDFHLVDMLQLPFDGLIGRSTLASHDIDVFFMPFTSTTV